VERFFVSCFRSRYLASYSKIRRAVGSAIREKRRATGLTQEKLAEKADLHPNYLGEVERGEKSISLEALYRIASSLGISIKDLTPDI
jgi:transcriptional regulator with XRE-family HTH domain